MYTPRNKLKGRVYHTGTFVFVTRLHKEGCFDAHIVQTRGGDTSRPAVCRLVVFPLGTSFYYIYILPPARLVPGVF